ncbi:secretin N-terminal domain-containing protein [Rubripirellula reticaptiva]|uniref:Bacterial type II/III secretion system short domain protein n=1 Tax=Rubripirellula reticaptiva TaxID=2528013 RepID=A0A5C6F920_9BACT|nr:secretin N-terminal domain-containing protein [Rubripirellula reticaptiva]TWU58243.1 Bacterial type II/III secretion system short domain protein [Rubripirellula reticaptiva]
MFPLILPIPIRILFPVVAIFVAVSGSTFSRLFGDEVTVTGPDGTTRTIQVPAGVKVPGGRPSSKPSKPSESGDEGDDKSGDDKSDDEKKKDDKDAGPKVIRRDATLDEKADASEFGVMVGDDGKVAFEFRNQPWVDLVEWLADISELPLDWLELPGDRVNMRSPGRYTVIETRDLFNRYLLARGYTLLEIDGGLTVAKTESINPAIVPRVEPDSLGTLPMHSFVRTSLDVGWLSAEKLTEELKPMISSNGRLTALTTTNRIEAMDAAVNLRQVAELLARELNSDSRESLAPEFKLRYLPAEEAKEMLEQFLGVEKKKATPLTPQQIQMMQQQRGQNQGAPPAEKKEEISIVANTRQNSVIIRAPADRIAIATEFLRRIDVQREDMMSLADVQTRVQVFRLSSLDPEKLIEIVSEMNVLEPTTRVRVDDDNNALIVSGSAADRFIISSLLERLDGTGRKFEVLPLRRLDPAEVAESIAFLMGQKDEDEKQSSRRSSYYYGYYGGGNDEEKKEKDEFRVSANIRYRQILLWANEREMEEVRSLLVKLGELPPPGGNSQTVRIMEASATPETYEYLQRLRQQWSRISSNPLELPDEDSFVDPNERADVQDDEESELESGVSDSEDDDEMDADKTDNKKQFDEDDSVAWDDVEARQGLSGQQQLAVFHQEGDDEATAEPTEQQSDVIRSSKDFDRLFGEKKSAPTAAKKKPASELAAIRIELDANGNLVLVSPDTEALDKLENLMLQVAPPKRPYRVFHIVHASAYWMRLNLEDYFKDLEEEDDSDADQFYRYFWGSNDDKKDKGPSGLGKGNKLRFIDDIDTNTLVVSSASSEQLQTITELIELWDIAEPVSKKKARFTSLVQIQFGKADKIAETVKEAYRDLLSSNDKTFAGGKGGNAGGGGGGGKEEVTKSREGSGSELQNSESGRDGGGADFSFKGKLSLGVDTIGNTILVSAEGEPLLELVTEMIDQLDEAAKPQGEVQIVELSGGINGERLQAALKALGAETTQTAGQGRNRNRESAKGDGEPSR